MQKINTQSAYSPLAEKGAKQNLRETKQIPQDEGVRSRDVSVLAVI
jgi:hypothetical protein